MTPALYLSVAIEPALLLLPYRMNSPTARVLLLAIGLQESRFGHRRQVGGPARSFFQFETGGVQGVLSHHASADPIRSVLKELAYPEARWTVPDCLTAIEHNDILAAAFARCLLWTLPTALPLIGDVDAAWKTYLSAWRPGKPHSATWKDMYVQAQALVPTTTDVMGHEIVGP